MKYKIVFFIITLISSATSFGQYNYEWAKKAGGKSLDASVTDESGNTYVTGKFVNATFGTYTLTSINGYTDVFIAKFNNAGNCIWAKRCGTPNNDFGYGIALDENQNCIVVGEISGSGDDADFGVHNVTTVGQADIFVTKLDSAGNFLWATGDGGAFDDIAEVVDVDYAGNIYVGGRVSPGAMFGGISAPSQGTFLAKYDSSGICQWVRNNNTNSIDNIYGITTDSSGNSLVTGLFTTTATFGTFSLTSAGDGDIFMAKFNNSGTCLWARRIGGTLQDSGKAITVDDTGNIYVAGYFANVVDFDCSSLNNVSNGYETYVSKYNSSGDCIWVNRSIGGYGNWPLAIQLDRFGYVYVTGWFRNYFEIDSMSYTAIGAEDIYLAKFNPNGKCATLLRFGASSPDNGTGLGIDSSDNLYFTGFFEQSIDFNPSPTVTNYLHSSSGPSVFIAKYALCPPDFYQVDTTHCGPTSFEFPEGGLFGTSSSIHTSYLVAESGCDSIITTDLNFIAINSTVSIQNDTLTALLSADSYQWLECINGNSFSIIPGANTQFYHPDSSGYYAIELTSNICGADTSNCYFISLMGMDEMGSTNTLKVFPNPTNDKLFFEDEKGVFTFFELIDISGKLVLNGTFDNKELKEISVSDFENGIYVLKLFGDIIQNIPIIIEK